MVWLGRDLKDFQHLVDSREHTMDDPHGAVMGLAGADLAWVRLGVSI